MKVLHILYSGLGGHGSVFFSMVNADEDNRYEYRAVFNGIEDVREEYVRRCKQKDIPYRFIKKQPGKHLSFYTSIYQAVRAEDPDIIFLHGSMAIASAVAAKMKSARKPRIIVRETQAMHMKTRAEKIALRISMALADNIVFLSEEYKDDVKRSLGSWYRPHKVAVIPNGIDLSYFYPVPHPPGNPLVLGMQSRLVAIKDHLTLFHALKIIKSTFPAKAFQLLIAGDGEYRARLEKAVDEAGLQTDVVFTGMLNEDQLPEFLRSLDIYIHASLGETMSTAIMQAMACGLPIIASDVDGINNMITHGENGILVPVKDPQAMADAITGLAGDEALRNRLSQKALEHARRHFSNKLMFANYARIFSGGGKAVMNS